MKEKFQNAERKKRNPIFITVNNNIVVLNLHRFRV